HVWRHGGHARAPRIAAGAHSARSDGPRRMRSCRRWTWVLDRLRSAHRGCRMRDLRAGCGGQTLIRDEMRREKEGAPTREAESCGSEQPMFHSVMVKRIMQLKERMSESNYEGE